MAKAICNIDSTGVMIVRVIKLSRDLFERKEDVDRFFGPDLKTAKGRDPLRANNPVGAFYFDNQIAADGIKTGETILITYEGKLRYIAKSASSRKNNQSEPNRGRHFFVIDMDTLVRTREISSGELQNLFDSEGSKVNLKSQAWNRIEETDSILNSVYDLIDDDYERIAALDIVAKEMEEGRFHEGKKSKVLVNKYERNTKARARAMNHHGTTCLACGFNFEQTYGERGKNYIDVHHIKPISSYEKETEIDPINDLTVVCANCHRMIHRYPGSPLSIEELVNLISNASKKGH